MRRMRTLLAIESLSDSHVPNGAKYNPADVTDAVASMLTNKFCELVRTHLEPLNLKPGNYFVYGAAMALGMGDRFPGIETMFWKKSMEAYQHRSAGEAVKIFIDPSVTTACINIETPTVKLDDGYSLVLTIQTNCNFSVDDFSSVPTTVVQGVSFMAPEVINSDYDFTGTLLNLTQHYKEFGKFLDEDETKLLNYMQGIERDLLHINRRRKDIESLVLKVPKLREFVYTRLSRYTDIFESAVDKAGSAPDTDPISVPV